VKPPGLHQFSASAKEEYESDATTNKFSKTINGTLVTELELNQINI